jgi:hypothetical protein
MSIDKFKPMAYLASQYTSHFPIKFIAKLIMKYRWHMVSKQVVPLMMQGYVVFGPITHSHTAWVKAGIKDDVQTDHDFWMSQDWWYVSRCDIMFVYNYKYGGGSTGVDREIEWCKQMNKDIVYLNKKGNIITNA